MSLTFGSLCDGIGCFSLGLARAGLSPRWLVEIDAHCRRVTARHFPRATQYEDMRDVGRHNLEPVDVLVGGTPCQDVSVAGRRAGLAGERSGLFHEFARIADEIAPHWILWENVPGAFTTNKGRDFATILGAFTGYTPEVPKTGWRNSGICVGPKRGAAWRVLDAQYVGGCPLHVDERRIGPVPQSRRRIFLVASPGNGCGPVKVLFEPESSERNPSPRGKARARVARTIRGRSSSRGVSSPGRGGEDDENLVAVYQANGAATERSGPVSLASSDDNGTNQIVLCAGTSHASYQDSPVATAIRSASAGITANLVTHALRAEGADASEDGTGRGTPLVVCIKGAADGRALENGPQRGDYREDDTLFALSTNEVHAVVAGPTVRRLLPVECLRLMGLPDDWLDVDPPLSDSRKYHMIGNGGVTFVVEWIGRRILAALREGVVS